MAVKSAAVKSTTPKSVTQKIKRIVLDRDKHCQFIDRKTRKICGSKLFLEIDHIQPRFAEGNHATENLRILCKNHNIFRYNKGM